MFIPQPILLFLLLVNTGNKYVLNGKILGREPVFPYILISSHKFVIIVTVIIEIQGRVFTDDMVFDISKHYLLILVIILSFISLWSDYTIKLASNIE